ncbi:hypothetical protein LTR17_018593 [Elasticomyces elasticus]|nr:hypothetical protein LTR17_018593 [Elasticomyces elasticus]
MATTSESARAKAYAAGVRDMQISHYCELQDEIPEASYQISSMQTTLRNLHVLLDTDGPAALTRPLVKALEETSTSALCILNACGKHWEYVWKPTERSASVAQRVFTIPELCENILGYLPTNLDLYRAMRTNQAMAAAVRGSPSMQKALGSAPANQGHWYTPFDYDEFGGHGWNHPHGFTCYMVGKSSEQPTLATVTARFELRKPGSTLRGVMAAFRNVQICTPSIREMECYVDCCDRWRNQAGYGISDSHQWDWDETRTEALPASKPITPVRNPEGITVGDIFKATLRLKEEHRLCPYAKESDVDLESGSVRVDVFFKGQIKLSPDDPVVMAGQNLADGWSERVPDERDLRIRAQTQIRTGYVKAKTDALRHGMPIPTLVEYASRLTAEQIETGRDLVDEASDLLQSTTIDGEAAEASSWN